MSDTPERSAQDAKPGCVTVPAASTYTRRQFFLVTSGVFAWWMFDGSRPHAAEASPFVGRRPTGPARFEPNILPRLYLEAVRADDLAVFRVSLVGFTLDESARKLNRNAGDAFIALELPPQAIGERTYDTVAVPPMPVPAVLAGSSRLVFVVPTSVPTIDYSLEAILSACRNCKALNVPATAKAPSFPAPNPIPAILRPSALETAIELPFRLILSPDAGRAWAYSPTPVTQGPGRTELWHARLRSRDGNGVADEAAATVRAVWNRDRDVQGSPPQADPLPLSVDNRDRLVDQTANLARFGGDPPAVSARQLILTSLGGWARLDYASSPPANTSSPWITSWKHSATAGRDHHVRVVTEFIAMPWGLRAIRTEVTERSFTGSQDGTLVAHLRKRTDVDILQPSQDYLPLDPEQEQAQHRRVPFPTVRIATPSFQDVAIEAAGLGSDRAFWPLLNDGSGTPVQFQIIAEDRAGNTVNFSGPLIFVERGTVFQSDHTDLRTVCKTFNDRMDRATSNFKRQKVAFAHPSVPGAGDTSFETDAIRFASVLEELPNLPAYGLPFYPAIASPSLEITPPAPGGPPIVGAQIVLPALKDLLGIDDPTPVIIDEAIYLSRGLKSDNPSQMFLSIVGAAKPLAWPSDRSGGVAAPNLAFDGVSRLLGAVGDAANLAAGRFEPARYFLTDAVNGAKILGSISLADILRQFTLLQTPNFERKIPNITTRVLSDAVESAVRFTTDVHSDGSVFEPLPNSTLTLEGLIRRPFSGIGQTTSIKGTLTNFSIVLLSETAKFLSLQFKSITFQSQTGKKMSVEVDLGGVTFGRDLEFVRTLASFLNPGKGPTLNIIPSGPDRGIQVGFNLPIPSVTLGVFSLQNIRLAFGFHLPFDNAPLRFSFAFGERFNPFTLTAGIFGGGGYFSLEMSPKGLTRLEAALEFGGNAALSLGVATGAVYVMAGLRYVMRQEGGQNIAQLDGYLRCGGLIQVLGLISLSLTFYMGLSYLPTEKTVWGRAVLTVQIKIAFFSKSVELVVERRFAGSGESGAVALFNDGTDRGVRVASALTGTRLLPFIPAAPAPPLGFTDLMTKEEWRAYCGAFA